ncbi:hypothetical protein NC651_003741 [Populus alba x Populus x berolinensis]|nr:hypothetical protein NC651_003741 [Populus alba x Populus x berolinensis]
MSRLQAEEETQKAFGWAARDSSGILSPFHFTRRANGDNDITIKILYCGICHSDLHIARNDFGFAIYPVVPGHEIVGVVTQVGKKVDRFKVGDKAGVGCLIGSCGNCENCQDDMESYCSKSVYTYTIFDDGGAKNYGGYSDHFAIRFPDNLSLGGGAPLLCAGITVFSPMKYFGLDKAGMHLGVVGLGGLGHLAVKFAKAFGMKAATGTINGIIDTVAAVHPLKPLLDLLKTNGKLILVGAQSLEKPLEVPAMPLYGRKLVSGSMAGGIKETQEMIDFAAEHNIEANVEVIPMDYVNKAMDRLAKGAVRYRFVIDITNTL